MKRIFYNMDFSRFGENELAQYDERTVSYRNVTPIVDKSYFVPSSEAVKRIQRKNEVSHTGLYDSEESLKHGIEPSWIRHPSRDIVEVHLFTESLYKKLEESLSKDISEAERKSLEKQKKYMETIQDNIQAVIDEQKTVIKKE